MRDKTGYETLLSVAKADKLNKWMYDTIQPFVKGNILELGSGLGAISKYFISAGANITVSDVDEDYLVHLKKEFEPYPNVKDFLSIDLQKENFNSFYADLKEKFDTVFLLNVMEHLDNDKVALQHLNFLLKQNGTLIILVPAYSFLYSELDKQLGHYRRYTKKSLTEKIRSETFTVKKTFYFNLMGVPAWLYGKIAKLKTLPPNEMKFYNKLVPFAKLLDKFFFKKAGLSVIAIAHKN